MSEYQHYAFAAVDRQLTADEMAELRALAKRATITPTQFVLELHTGDFDGRPDDLMVRLFDAHTYVSNWGTTDFQLRLPKEALVRDVVKPYLVEERLEVRQKGEILILTLHLECGEKSNNAEGAADWLPGLLPLRKDIMAGDLRALYLGWLTAVQDGIVADGVQEPPVPKGLDALTPPLEVLARLLRLDGSMIAVAAGSSATLRTAKALKAAAKQHAEDKQRSAADQAGAARNKVLDALKAREEQAWSEVAEVIGMPGAGPTKTAAFKAKAKLLHELRELATRDGASEAFDARLAALRERFIKVPGFWMFYDPPRVSKAFGQ
ncbi:MAG: hypothetical protein JWM80_5935 [Cyanobacteria bacterium RYN_339]|nr:hypothetical protein [Cyanobacteria bacterium RYN_339]